MSARQSRCHRRGGDDEPDQVAHRLEGAVLAGTAHGRAAHLGVPTGRLLAAQYGIQQLHRDEVREPRNHHLRELLGGTHHVQRGPDPHSGLVQQLQALPGDLGRAGQRPQLGGVPERRGSAGGTAVRGGGPCVDGQQPVTGQVDLVGHRAARGQQLGDGGIEAQTGDVPPLRAGGQLQESARLVVHQRQPAVVPDDEHALPDSVQNRVVVLVHPGHLGGAEAVRLPSQSPAHEYGAACGQGERSDGGGEERRQVTVHRVPDVLDRDARGDQADDGAVGGGDGDDGPGRVVRGALEDLREGSSGSGAFHALGALADQRRIGVGVPGAVRRHHRHEVHARAPLGRVHVGPQRGGRITGPQRLDGARALREGLRGSEGPVPGVPLAVLARLERECDHRDCDQQYGDHDLEEEHLARGAAHLQQRTHTSPRRASETSTHAPFLALSYLSGAGPAARSRGGTGGADLDAAPGHRPAREPLRNGAVAGRSA